jgi:uncharacterized membrane protein
MATNKDSWTLAKILPWMLLIGGVIGVLSSAVLGVEYINSLKNPGVGAFCDLNPIFSCSSVSASDQASAFGLHNNIIGLAGYGAVTAIGAALLAGAAFRRWFWQLLNTGLLLSVAFLTWLQFETLYRIGALCLFCMIIWAVTIPMFWYTLLHSLREGHLKTPKSLAGVVAFVQRHHADILILWFLIIIGLILKRFWYYWQTLI